MLRAVLLGFLVCYHVVGAAVLFRRLFPRESPWFAFIVPTLIVMFVFNFVEHFVALPQLGWLLPVTIIGLGWGMARPGARWDGLYLPGAIFLGLFWWIYLIRCLNPSITANTEGVADMARVLDFCLGYKLPAIDTWCPPYDHGGYYTFQHYGASLLKRLFTVDIGTGYNLGYTLLNTFEMFVGAAAAYALGGRQVWICLVTLLVLLANFNGASVVLFFWDLIHPMPNLYDIFDSRLASDIGDGWNDPSRHNPFGWIYRDPPPGLRLFTPAYDIYNAEFHANIGGDFMTLASIFAAGEAFRLERSNWPWIALIIFPIMTIITATWFLVIVWVLCLGSLAALLIAGRRPQDWRVAGAGAGIALLLIWPSVNTLLSGSGSYPVDIHFTPWIEYTNPLEFLIQWWPVLLPWLCLLFIWDRLNLLARWLHAAVPLLLIFVEVVTFSDRTLTVEKAWGALFGAGIVSFLPLVCLQGNLIFRQVTGLFVVLGALFLIVWAKISFDQAWPPDVLRLHGDIAFQADPQKKRIEQVLQRFRGVTVLAGKAAYSYNEAPSIVGFSENMCYIAWYFQEYQCGHGGEAEFRGKQDNDFFAGTLEDPLGFLHSNRITAVMIYPDDKIPDDLLDKLKGQIGADYFYIDCKGDGVNNAGVFVKKDAP
ncbi:MAG: hypothetical protein WDO13_04750 [Verrucomicrobiota bacterium]